MLIFWLLISLGVILSLLVAWRGADHIADRQAMAALIARQPVKPACFDPAMVAELPEPARRYFLYSIAPGTPLYRVVRLTMVGKFGMGDKSRPNYLPMRATQVLSVPEGFVWKMQAKRSWMALSGSDSDRWTRFWAFGLLPVARLGGDPDHRRSAFGRYVAEAVFWSPAAVLPGPGIHWEAVNEHCARVTVNYKELSQSVELTINEQGQPIQVAFARWSNANPDKVHRLQPFGGYLSEFRQFDGFTLPSHVEAGNHFGTDEYFPFFIANITSVKFPLGAT